MRASGNTLFADGDFEVRAALYRLLGVDLTQIYGIGPGLALKLVGK